MRTLIFFGLLAGAAIAADDFVLIRGGEVRPGSAWSRVDDFEMAVHPVTNAEYKPFVDASRHAAPLHWPNGRIPAGMERHPVIFVNRYDVDAYLKWRSKAEHRAYRLPTASEFEFAARGGVRGGTYPWGKDAPEGKANYDANGQRTFAEWRKYLKPVQSYEANAFGLYDMSGNAWQMVDTNPDDALARFKYRVENPVAEENSLAGGSWARSEYYLRCGVRGGASSGIRHPDIGFRLIREPAGSTHFQRQPRRLIAAATGEGAIFLGWQLLAQDAPTTGFHIYRTTRRDTAG
jgi:formylglycine-generating enzyme required for sulfatase activity